MEVNFHAIDTIIRYQSWDRTPLASTLTNARLLFQRFIFSFQPSEIRLKSHEYCYLQGESKWRQVGLLFPVIGNFGAWKYDLFRYREGKRYFDLGLDYLSKNLQDLALKEFQMAASYGYANAYSKIGEIHEAAGDPQAAEAYMRGVERGDADSLVGMAMLSLQGKYVPLDKQNAEKYLEVAMLHGNAQAHKERAILYFKNKQYNEALNCYVKAGELGEPDAFYEAGVMLLQGRGVAKNPDAATSYFRNALKLYMNRFIKTSDFSILRQIGNMFIKGHGVPKDGAMGTLFYHYVDSQSNKDDLMKLPDLNLGDQEKLDIMMLELKGNPDLKMLETPTLRKIESLRACENWPIVSTVKYTWVIFKKCRNHFRDSDFIEQRHEFRYLQSVGLGRCVLLLIPGFGNLAVYCYHRYVNSQVKKLITKADETNDLKEKAKYLENAVQLGSPEALFKLSKMNNSQPLYLSHEKEIHYYQKFADQGNLEAIAELAIRYETGTKGLSKDLRMAESYYRIASSCNHAYSCFKLGKFYQTGAQSLYYTINPDPKLAAEYFLKNAQLGNPEGYLWYLKVYEKNREIEPDKQKVQGYFDLLVATCFENARKGNGTAFFYLTSIILHQWVAGGRALAEKYLCKSASLGSSTSIEYLKKSYKYDDSKIAALSAKSFPDDELLNVEIFKPLVLLNVKS